MIGVAGGTGPARGHADSGGPEGSVEAARKWLADVALRGDIGAAWRRTDPDFRLALIQAILLLNEDSPLVTGRDRGELEHDLSLEEPMHPLWPSSASLLLEEFHHVLGEIDGEILQNPASSPVGPGYELVLFENRGRPAAVELPEMSSQGVLMHVRDGRWLVAGLSARPAVPGRPPDLGY